MNDDGEDDDHDGGWPKCSGDPSEAELSPGTLRRAVISQVTLVWFPTNTSAIPFYPLHLLQGHRRWTIGQGGASLIFLALPKGKVVLG